MAQCFTYKHPTAAVGQGGYGHAESPGLFLASRHAERAFTSEYCFLRPSRLRPVSPWVWSLLASAYPCTRLEGGVNCFVGTMRCSQQRLGPGPLLGTYSKTLVLFWEGLGPGAATDELCIPSHTWSREHGESPGLPHAAKSGSRILVRDLRDLPGTILRLGTRALVPEVPLVRLRSVTTISPSPFASALAPWTMLLCFSRKHPCTIPSHVLTPRRAQATWHLITLRNTMLPFGILPFGV